MASLAHGPANKYCQAFLYTSGIKNPLYHEQGIRIIEQPNL
jgi:hypothetical protein